MSDSLERFLTDKPVWDFVWNLAVRKRVDRTRRQYESASVICLCSDLKELLETESWLTLRILALFMNGSVIILDKQIAYLHNDVNKYWLSFCHSRNYKATTKRARKKKEAVTFPNVLSLQSVMDSFLYKDGPLAIAEEGEFIPPVEEDNYIVSDQSLITMSDEVSLHSIIIKVPPEEGFGDDSLTIDPNTSIDNWIPIIDGDPRPILPPESIPPSTPSTPITPNTPATPMEATPMEATPTDNSLIPRESKGFISPFALELPELPVKETQRRGFKKKLKFDEFTQLKGSRKTPSDQETLLREPDNYKLPKKLMLKYLYSAPSSHLFANAQLRDLWHQNLQTIGSAAVTADNKSPQTDPVPTPPLPEERSEEMEVMRKEPSYDEPLSSGAGWAGTHTPLYTDVSGSIGSVNHSSELDFIMSTAKRTLEGRTAPLRGSGMHLSPIIDEGEDDDCLIDYVNEEVPHGNCELNVKIRRCLNESSAVSFESLVPKTVKKKKAAAEFQSLLGLLQVGAIKVRQDEPYGPIILTKGDKFEL